jgi:hypothetical protein
MATRLPLRTRVYAALVALTVLTSLFTWWQWDKQWVHEWMPNFIAEWSGLIVAVVIVDQLLARAREAERQRRRAPERQVVGDRLAQALDRVISAAAQEWSLGGRELEPAAPVPDFWTAWLADFENRHSVRDPAWRLAFAHHLRAASGNLNRIRTNYDAALEPGERAHIATLSHRLSEDGRAIEDWSGVLRIGDPNVLRRSVQQLNDDDIVHKVANRCTGLTRLFVDVAGDYRAMTGVELTSESAWDSVRLMRAGVEYVAMTVAQERVKSGRTKELSRVASRTPCAFSRPGPCTKQPSA